MALPLAHVVQGQLLLHASPVVVSLIQGLRPTFLVHVLELLHKHE